VDQLSRFLYTKAVEGPERGGPLNGRDVWTAAVGTAGRSSAAPGRHGRLTGR
jgi:hypothetical protein